MTEILGYDPGLATGALAAVRFPDRKPLRPRFVASAEWKPRKEWDVARKLFELERWLNWFYGSDSGFREIRTFSYEDQAWSRIPGKLGRSTNAHASQPMMAQSVAVAWAGTWADRIVSAQPVQVRSAALGTGAKFRCSVKLPPKELSRLRRQHDQRVRSATRAAVQRLVVDVPPNLSDHEIDAICCTLAAQRKMVNAGQWRDG